LRSYKAIAFINRKADMRLKVKTYFILRMSLKMKPQIFPENIKPCVATALDVAVVKKLGDEKWKK